MLVGDPLGGEIGGKFSCENLLKNVFESTVIHFENRIFCRKIHRVATGESVAKTGPGEVANRVIEVVHRHRNASGWKVEDLEVHRLRTIRRRKCQRQHAWAGNLHVGSAVLIPKGVTANNNRLGPARHQTGNIADDDRLAKNHPSQ